VFRKTILTAEIAENHFSLLASTLELLGSSQHSPNLLAGGEALAAPPKNSFPLWPFSP